MKISELIPTVSTKYGAPMGRSNLGTPPPTVVRGNSGRICKCDQIKVYDKKIPMSKCGAYDKGGAYWGIGKELRVRYTDDLSYIEYYRMP